MERELSDFFEPLDVMSQSLEDYLDDNFLMDFNNLEDFEDIFDASE